MSMISKMHLCALGAIFVTILFTHADAMAHSCDRETSYTQAEAFLRADSVFVGTALNERPDGHIFEIKEWYQSPNVHAQTGDKVFVRTFRGGYVEEREYIIFGVDTGIKAEYPVVQDQPCLGASGFSAESVITELDQWAKDPAVLKEKLTDAHDMILIARATQVKITEKQRPVLNKPPMNYVSSEIEFEVIRLFKNESHRQSLKPSDRILMNARSCGDGYEVGQSYLVFAEDNYQRRTNEEKFRVNCMPPARIINVDEKTRLYELRRESGYKRK